MARKLTPQAIAAIKRRMKAVPASMKLAAEAELRRTADLMAEQMRRDAPDDEGDLRTTVEVIGPQRDPETGAIFVRVQAGGEATTTTVGTRTYDRAIRLGSGDTAGAKKMRGGNRLTYDYATSAEYGYISKSGRHVPAQPFFWPNYRRHRKRVRAGLTRALKRAVKAMEGS